MSCHTSLISIRILFITLTTNLGINNIILIMILIQKRQSNKHRQGVKWHAFFFFSIQTEKMRQVGGWCTCGRSLTGEQTEGNGDGWVKGRCQMWGGWIRGWRAWAGDGKLRWTEGDHDWNLSNSLRVASEPQMDSGRGCKQKCEE